MKSAALLLFSLFAVSSAAASSPPATGEQAGSRLAIPALRGASGVPELWLAQRSIDREWGLSEDSTYRTLDMQGWKHEGLALSLSGLVPGTGQLYVGERSGWAYLLAEGLGWVGRTVTRRRGDNLRAEAAAFVGDPNDPSAPWSFERYATNSGDEAELLRTLWEQDRAAFYELLSSDPRYREGFAAADPTVAFETYHNAHERSQSRYRQSRYIEIALWANHAIAAFDALRAARLQNLPLRRNIELQLGGRVSRDGPTLRASLVRRF